MKRSVRTTTPTASIYLNEAELKKFTEPGISNGFFIDFKEWINPDFEFSLIRHLHTKKEPIINNGVLRPSKYYHTLWLGYEQRNDAPYIICDRDGYMNENRLKLPLKPLQDQDQIRQYVRDLPPKKEKKLRETVSNHGIIMRDDMPVEHYLAQYDLFHTPIKSLKNPEVLREFEWAPYVDFLISMFKGTDPRFDVIRKPLLLKGIKPEYNPHAIISLNGGVGKSTWFDSIGKLDAKVTAKAFLGYADTDGIHPGTLDGNDYPYAIDQVESGAWGITRYLFNVMEQGSTYVSGAASRFKVSANCPLIFLSNPLGYGVDNSKSFGNLLNHLSENPVMGRRFPIIVYDNNYKRPDKAQDTELSTWRDGISFFRAVEQHAQQELRDILDDPRVFEWINQGIDNYAEQITDITSSVEENTTRLFLREHGRSGQHRIRSAAVYSALVDNLDQIALGTHSIEDILRTAEETLPSIIEVNLESILNIVQSIDDLNAQIAQATFNGLPKYQKEIVSAIELYRREEPENTTFNLNQLNDKYTPAYKNYLSQHIETLRAHPNSVIKLNEITQRHMGFSISPSPTGFTVQLHDPTPNERIKPVGNFHFYHDYHFSTASGDTSLENFSPRGVEK